MERYIHKVNYYETDKMGMTHHSNYVRWMEEARIAMMDQMGYSYKKLEEIGIGSPVLGYSCNIKKSTYFDDKVEIIAKIKDYNSVRLTVEYEMSVNGDVVAKGETRHCFINKECIPIRLNKVCKELDDIIKENLNNKE